MSVVHCPLLVAYLLCFLLSPQHSDLGPFLFSPSPRRPISLSFPNPAKPESNRFEELKNPKSEYRNPKQIRNSKVQSHPAKKNGSDLEYLDLFRILNFVLRPALRGIGTDPFL
jgi:hypothetical protein